jgi:2Fe-2S ferredoxin
MPNLNFIDDDGTRTSLQVAAGTSVKDAAIDNGLDGIVAECGGNLMCATCHVYVEEDWIDALPAPEPEEEFMLSETTSPRAETSRLGCQLIITEELNGLTIRFPPQQ